MSHPRLPIRAVLRKPPRNDCHRPLRRLCNPGGCHEGHAAGLPPPRGGPTTLPRPRQRQRRSHPSGAPQARWAPSGHGAWGASRVANQVPPLPGAGQGSRGNASRTGQSREWGQSGGARNAETFGCSPARPDCTEWRRTRAVAIIPGCVAGCGADGQSWVAHGRYEAQSARAARLCAVRVVSGLEEEAQAVVCAGVGGRRPVRRRYW